MCKMSKDKEMSTQRVITSIVSYPERGEGGNNRYRGNCSPKLIEDIIRFFKPQEICDYMCGSGTTRAAADRCGIDSHTYDLHSGFDIMNCEIPERPEFVFWHPPYWDIVVSDAVTLDFLYKQIENHKKAKENKWWREKVRQTLQLYPTCFQHTDRGMWRLKQKNSIKN